MIDSAISRSLHRIRHRAITTLWWSSGAVPTVLRELSEHDRTKYASIGAAVLASALLSSLAAAYAVQIFIANSALSALSAVLWAALLISMNRTIVMSMRTRGGGDYSVVVMRVVLRLILAVAVGLVVAYPLGLAIFAKEIDQRTQLEQSNAVNRADEQIARLGGEIAAFRQQLDRATGSVNDKLNSYLAEINGRDATRISGMGPVANTKRQVYEESQRDLKQLEVRIEEQIREDTGQIAALRSQRAELLRQSSTRPSIIARIDALRKLKDENSYIRWFQLPLILLIVFIEAMPLLLKMLAPADLYEYTAEHHDDEPALRRMRELPARTEKVTVLMQKAFTEAIEESDLNPRRKEVGAS